MAHGTGRTDDVPTVADPLDGTMHPLLTRITATIGVEVAGLDLTRPLGDIDLEVLRACLAEHHVVVLRDEFLSAAQHAAVAESFAPILRSPVHVLIGRHQAVSTIEDTEARPPAGFPWHTDQSWLREGPVLGFLHAVTIPEFGGDTLWASTAAVYDGLTDAEREQCDRLTAVHAPDPSLLASIERHHGRTVVDRLRAEHPRLEQPLVRIHPATGRRSLFLSPLSTTHIVGPAGADGSLLERLNRRLDDPQVQMRWRWRPGDFVIWDETTTCHRALTDHHPQRRVMRRCVTAGR
ncbi:MAG: Taurine dioxygenase [Ilumatobacteraceae bacterium]|nr:Taurine dioxygenase [Ilumatobacteraceae bacterium]